MAKRKANPSDTSPVISGIAVGAAISLAITVIGAMAGAFLLSAEILTHEQIGMLSTVITAIAAAAGSLVASKKIGKMKMQMCLLTGAVYFLVLCIVTVLAFNGLFLGVGKGILSILIGSSSVALLSVVNKKHPKFKFQKKTYR